MQEWTVDDLDLMGAPLYVRIHAIVCLLSVLFLLPYCSRGHAPLLLSLGGWCLATYSFLVLPLLISANYKYPTRWLRNFICSIPGLVKKFSGPAINVLRKIYSPLDKCERVFMKMTNLSNMAIQLTFFLMCDRVLLCSLGGTNCPQKRVTGLYSLMFYNVIAYCVSYIKELIEKEDWSPYVNISNHSNVKHLAMSATKIFLEWTKAVTFIITVIFMLLVFSLEQGLEHYQPTMLYTMITWTFYMATEKVFNDIFLGAMKLLKIQRFEALEHLYAPVILRYYTITAAVMMGVVILMYGQLRFGLLAMYLTVFLRGKDMVLHCLKDLRSEEAVLGRFRKASPEEIDDCDDVCAVCLSMMKRARVTPCQHMFHAECLRECLNNSDMCPIYVVKKVTLYLLQIPQDIHSRIEGNLKNITYQNLHLLCSHMIFFTLCDCVLLVNGEESKQRVVCALTTLLLYTIITFFGTKIQKIISKPEHASDNESNPPNPGQNATHPSNTIYSKSILINFLKIILEFLKAAMVILCLREQGLRYHYDLVYTSITSTYFILSEEFYLDVIYPLIPSNYLFKLRISPTGNDSLDAELKRLTFCVISTAVTILMAATMLIATNCTKTQFLLMLLVIVYLPAVKMNVLYVGVLREYWSFLEKFPNVSELRLKEFDDVCAICLDEMVVIKTGDNGFDAATKRESVRETPCGHIFHFSCLLRSLEVIKMCPFCKFDFTQ